MLKVIKAWLDGLDEANLPDSQVAKKDWSYEQYCLVDTMRQYHQYLWYDAKPSKTADKLFVRLSKYLNRDCGYVFIPTKGNS